MSAAPHQVLSRQLGLADAVLIGLGSIVGTGVYVSLGLAASVAGNAVLGAILAAGCLALMNGASSARLAAIYPVSGGTYEYAYRLVSPTAGFAAGWLFIVAKLSSAATAVLGASAYAWRLAGVHAPSGSLIHVGLAVVMAVAIGLAAARGHGTTRLANLALLTISLVALGAFAAASLVLSPVPDSLAVQQTPSLRDLGATPLLHAVAILFVAFTGYGRVATLGEEVKNPARTVPIAVFSTLALAMGLYLLVAAGALRSLGAAGLAAATAAGAAPLESAAQTLPLPWLRPLIALGATASMVAVASNLVLGISRVVVAMARRGDLPSGLCAMHQGDAGGAPVPRRAVIATTLLIMALAALGSVKLTWELSAFTILSYYAMTHLAALRLKGDGRGRAWRWAAWGGFASCAGLAWWVPWKTWVTGVALTAAGLIGRAVWLYVFRVKAGQER